MLGEVLRWVARFLMGFLRSIPEIVWAYLLVRIFGLGPGAAVFAIALTVGGSIGKLYSELAEAVNPWAIHALRASGASRWAILLFAVLPQVGRQWIAYGLFRLECNIRSGTILGVVGAGGLGSEIALSIRYFEYDKLATTLLAVLAFVVVLEIISAKLRKRSLRWTFAFTISGTLAAVALLDIPWADLLSPPVSSMGIFDGIVFDAAFLATAVEQVGETLMMAWVATVASAVLGFVLAPMAASHLTTGSYLPDPIRPFDLRLVAWHAIKLLSRCTLQITRAMPELTLALVFVVWVGPGPLAGILAIAVHNLGVMGRLYSDVLEEVEGGPPTVLQAQGASALATFLFGVLPQVQARLAAFTLYRFEVNVRATAMVGFVGAGGIGDSLYTAISLFHLHDLTMLLMTMLVVVLIVDAIGDAIRTRILRVRVLSASDESIWAGLEERHVHLPFTFGLQSVLITAFEFVDAQRLVVQTQSVILEGDCRLFKPDLIGASEARGLMVRATRLPDGVADDGAPAIRYSLVVCEVNAQITNLLDDHSGGHWMLNAMAATDGVHSTPNSP